MVTTTALRVTVYLITLENIVRKVGHNDLYNQITFFNDYV